MKIYHISDRINQDILNTIKLNLDPGEIQNRNLKLTSYVGPHSSSNNSDVNWPFDLSTVSAIAAYKIAYNNTK